MAAFFLTPWAQHEILDALQRPDDAFVPSLGEPLGYAPQQLLIWVTLGGVGLVFGAIRLLRFCLGEGVGETLFRLFRTLETQATPALDAEERLDLNIPPVATFDILPKFPAELVEAGAAGARSWLFGVPGVIPIGTPTPAWRLRLLLRLGAPGFLLFTLFSLAGGAMLSSFLYDTSTHLGHVEITAIGSAQTAQSLLTADAGATTVATTSPRDSWECETQCTNCEVDSGRCGQLATCYKADCAFRESELAGFCMLERRSVYGHRETWIIPITYNVGSTRREEFDRIAA